MHNYLRFDGVNFTREESSIYPHNEVRSLGNYRNSPFVTGQSNAINGLKTEILNYETNTWVEVDDYPFSNGDRFVYCTI